MMLALQIQCLNIINISASNRIKDDINNKSSSTSPIISLLWNSEYKKYQFSSEVNSKLPLSVFHRSPSAFLRRRRNHHHRRFHLPCRCSRAMEEDLRSASSSFSTTSPMKSLKTSDHLRHVESMSTLPSGAGRISRLNAVILGDSLASEEDDLVFPSQAFSDQAHVPSPQKYLEMYTRSIQDPAGFWSEIASQFYWKERWSQQVYSENLDIRKGNVRIEWFKGGVTNICYNCLDRNIDSGSGDRVAIYWEGNEPGSDGMLTYNQLLARVCQLANYLKDVGVQKGDAVVIYLPMLMELPMAMLACARIGAVHSVVFAGFSAESLAQRIMDCKPKVVISCNAVRRGSKVIYLKEIVDAALAECIKL